VSAILDKLLKGQKVEWKTLGDVSVLYGGLTGKNKADFENGNAKYVSYKNIFANLAVDLQNLGTVKANDNEKQHFIKHGDILFTGSSETQAEAGISSVVTEHPIEKIYLNSFSFGLRFNDDVELMPEFTKFLFRGDLMRTQIARTASGVTRFNISKERFKKIQVPIPPLDVQAEIVRILDAFTAVTAELTAELNMREKQYQYYRDKLLSFSDMSIETDSNRQQQTALCERLANNVKQNHQIIWKSLGEVAEYSKSRISFDKLNEKNYIGVDNLLQNRMGKTNSSYLPTSGNLTAYFENDILIGNIRPYLKKIWQANQIGGTNGDVLVIHLKDKNILPRYLYQILADDKFFDFNMQNAKGAKMPRGNKEAILKYSFPVPPLDEQKRIVNILDKFEALTHSITEGLPKEIALREQQYEYYREQLLDFPKN
jgi:type I restriction enzyme S subunit